MVSELVLERVIDDHLVAGHPLVQFDVVSELVLERVIDDLLVAGHPLVQLLWSVSWC